MIIEVADIQVKEGTEDAFVEAVKEAPAVLRQAKGWLGMHVQRCIEAPSNFQVVIRWDTLEDHTVHFREGPLFPEWRALVGPFFATPPVVKHYDVVMDRVSKDGAKT